MNQLEHVWDIVSSVGGGLMSGFERGVTSLFGSANARFLKKLSGKVDAINALEEKYKAKTDNELRQQTEDFKRRLKDGETLDDLLVEAFAVCREGGRRFLGMRHYDVQLLGGMILHQGNIAEMVTGEGKTLVATLPAYLNALDGKGVHVVTVNDYLARRDMEWMGPLYINLGLTVGAIQSGMSPSDRQRAYACDITYGTNNEFGFDYLRDNMRMASRGDDEFPKSEQQSQGPLNFAIIDEVDNILIDEARTPLIISGPATDDVTKYAKADRVARQLQRDKHFEVNEKDHSAHLNDEGIRVAEKLAGVESFFTAGNMEWPHLMDNALKAHHLYKRDVNYVVENGDIVIVDEFTGRLMHGRQWSDGLHQAVEAKEGVRIKEENQTLATITLQNFFKLYNKLAGMTGTAMTEAAEFWKIYKLDVIAVPTNKPLRRIEHPDSIYRSEKEKFEAIANEIERMNKWDTLSLSDGTQRVGTLQGETDDAYDIKLIEGGRQTVPKSSVSQYEGRGRPVLVGTVSIEKSERLSGLLDRRGIKHEILNAKFHKREAEIIAQAGREGAVTIATNMAGRGTDIVLGGNPETMAWAQLQEKYPTRLDVPDEEWEALVAQIEQREGMKAESEKIKRLGGLHVIGTERHEARRIDLQLRGRCGRQGDPGSSRFFLSLEDDLMRIFAGEWVKSVLTRLGMQEGEAIESRMVSRRIEGAQKKVEERNFEVRKNLLEYDEVMDEQRKRVYGYRQRILDGDNCRELIREMIDQQIKEHLTEFLAPDFGPTTFAAEAGRLLSVKLQPRDFQSADFASAEQTARDEAEREAESDLRDALTENLPEDEDPAEWNWGALAKLLNARWNLQVRDRELKSIGRDNLEADLGRQINDVIAKTDLSECARFLEPDFGLTTALEWLKAKFALELEREKLAEMETPQIIEAVNQAVDETYRQREAEYPVMAGLYHFTTRDASGHKRYERDRLIAWAQERFGVELSRDEFRNKQRDELYELLVVKSQESNAKTLDILQRLDEQIDELYAGASDDQEAGADERRNSLEKLVAWLNEQIGRDLDVDELARCDRDLLHRRLSMEVERRYRPEMRRLERGLVLQFLDTTWKDHLLVMDHLRSSVGLVGYAQVDPKVEYKREGMRLFDRMWESIGRRVTDFIFRMEQLPEDFVGSTWSDGQAIHESAPTEIAQQQQAAIDQSGRGDEKMAPIRKEAQRVGRNSPCPCGSGKKYKQCCMRREGGQRRAG